MEQNGAQKETKRLIFAALAVACFWGALLAVAAFRAWLIIKRKMLIGEPQPN